MPSHSRRWPSRIVAAAAREAKHEHDPDDEDEDGDEAHQNVSVRLDKSAPAGKVFGLGTSPAAAPVATRDECRKSTRDRSRQCTRGRLTLRRAGSLLRWASRSPSSASCAGSTGEGAFMSGSAPEDVFGKAMTSRMFLMLNIAIMSRSMPMPTPPFGRGAVFERIEDDAEAFLLLLGRMAHHAEDLGLRGTVVDADRAAANFDTVEGEVVLACGRPCRGRYRAVARPRRGSR